MSSSRKVSSTVSSSLELNEQEITLWNLNFKREHTKSLHCPLKCMKLRKRGLQAVEGNEQHLMEEDNRGEEKNKTLLWTIWKFSINFVFFYCSHSCCCCFSTSHLVLEQKFLLLLPFLCCISLSTTAPLHCTACSSSEYNKL